MATPGLKEWVARARNAESRELRQAVHTVLIAVATAPELPKHLALKGGILLALAHEGDRFTRDIDFSLSQSVVDLTPEQIIESLKTSLALAVQGLPYGLACRIQRSELKPPGEDKTMQTLKLSVGYAPLGDVARLARLRAGNATNTVGVDVSYNEIVTGIEVMELAEGVELHQSTLEDLVAEKYRAMLQQPIRNRVRRQDAYDLYRLIERGIPKDDEFAAEVLSALIAKCRARGIRPDRTSVADEQVRRRSQQEYAQLAQEIESNLPPFDTVYEAVRIWYEALPWQ